MPDASPMDIAAVLQRLDEIEKHGQSKILEPWVHLRTCDYLFLKELLRIALADTERWRTRLAQVCGELLATQQTSMDLAIRLEDALADTRRWHFVRDNFERIARSPRSPASSKWSWGLVNGRTGVATWYDDARTFTEFIDATPRET